MENDRDLRAFLANKGVVAEVIDLGQPMTTAAAAAEQLNVPIGMIFKSLVLCDQEGAMVVVLPGDRQVNFKAVTKLMGSKKLRFANREEVLNETGYPAGGTPPLGYPKPLRLVVDEAVLGYREGYGGGGKPELLLRITPEELIRVTNAIVGKVSTEQKGSTHA